MMLKNISKNIVIAEHLEIANGMFARMKGLLGRSGLSDGHAMLIKHCNSVHTFFMKFTIDVVFVNSTGIVIALFSNVKPGRMIWPVMRARSVYETQAGTIDRTEIEVGDHLDVVS